MITAFGEATVQQFVRASYNAEIFGKDQDIQKKDKTKKQRPVEKSEDGRKPEISLQSQDKLKTRNRLENDNGQIIVEKYDERGKLVKKTPPGHLPFGEMA